MVSGNLWVLQAAIKQLLIGRTSHAFPLDNFCVFTRIILVIDGIHLNRLAKQDERSIVYHMNVTIGER